MQPPAPGVAGAGPMQPPPPGATSNYVRPGYAPQYGTADTGTKELWSAFGTAVAAPIVGLLLIYGMFIAIAGIQFAWKAHQKGHKLAILALILNILALPVAFYMRFILRYQLLHNSY
jgi:hypothetical protein